MAKATKEVITVTSPPYKLILELSQHEAEALRSLVGDLCNPGTEYEAIYDALERANVKRLPGATQGVRISPLEG